MDKSVNCSFINKFFEESNFNNENNSSNDYENYYTLKIESFSESFLGEKETITQVKKKKMIANINKRTFIFPLRELSHISCFKVSITEISVINDFLHRLKSSAKIIIMFAFYLLLWYYIAVFIQSIYKQYGDNIFQICVMPLISMFFIKLVFVVNIMIFVTTLLLHYKGASIVNSSKKNIYWNVIFIALVPPAALNHYMAINYFIKISEMYK